MYLVVAHQAFSTATFWLLIPRQVTTGDLTWSSFRLVYPVGPCATGSPARHICTSIAGFTAPNGLFPQFHVSTVANSPFFGCFECGCPAPSAATWHLGTFQAFGTAPLRLLPQGNELTVARFSFLGWWFEGGFPAPRATPGWPGTFQAFRAAPFRLLRQWDLITIARFSFSGCSKDVICLIVETNGDTDCHEGQKQNEAHRG